MWMCALCLGLGSANAKAETETFTAASQFCKEYFSLSECVTNYVLTHPETKLAEVIKAFVEADFSKSMTPKEEVIQAYLEEEKNQQNAGKSSAKIKGSSWLAENKLGSITAALAAIAPENAPTIAGLIAPYTKNEVEAAQIIIAAAVISPNATQSIIRAVVQNIDFDIHPERIGEWIKTVVFFNGFHSPEPRAFIPVLDRNVTGGRASEH